MKKRGADQIVRTACPYCNVSCSVLVHLRNGKPIHLEGDPEGPLNKGFICPKGATSLELCYHPDRLKFPLKRVGERGDGRWQQIVG